MSVETELVEIQPFRVAGLAVRTTNAAERDPSTARLPGLWSDFFARGFAGRVPHKADGSPAYGVYAGYESDANGAYTVTAGVAVSATSADFASVQVEGGRYLVFKASGPMPAIVFEAWSAVWSHFADAVSHRRRFTTDFEAYPAPDSVAIHIALA